MQFQAFNKILLENQKLEVYTVDGIVLGYQFRIRYPSYRGTFLSCIEKLDFYLDGKKINPSGIYFELNGKEYLIDELKDQYKSYWFVLDYATIRVMTDEIPAPGSHEITVDMYHRIPYAGYNGSYLGLPSKVTQTLVCE